VPADRPVPSSTYRIQFSKDQTFDQVRELLPYLDALGVGALYASPLLETGPGSNHGYDVVDPTRISAERGGPDGLRALVAAVREHQLGFVLDIVPNHVGVAGSRENPWWWDVLRNGKTSAYATYFDIDWDAGPILLPVLDADEEKALSELALSEDGTELRYYEHAAPVAPGTEGGSAQEVHERQHYRFGSWKRGAAELTYRRFFDVSTLAAVRVEDPEVFAATHAEILRWVDEGAVDGLRVDHPDGLSDPGGYARQLRAAIGPDRWLVVEKILGVGEALPASWPVDGTSGYEALREIQGVFVDPDGAGLATQFAAEHTGRRESLHAAEHAARREVADTILAAEVRRIAAHVPGLAAPAPQEGDTPATQQQQGDTAATGVTVERAREAVAELLCGFPVYRSYLPEGRAALDTAVSVARTHRPDLADVLDGIHAAMLADPRGELATRVQQTSGMVMAKGVEDTTFYRWNRFVALNEVGGAPDRFGVSPAEFHAALAEREAARPDTMTTLSTHDTKRSEDVRARLAVLAEIPREWTDRVRRWAARHPLPDRSLDLLAWQNLVGAWPIPVDRMAGYLTKASKEAKLVTSHVEAVPEVDEAVAAWPAAVLADTELVAEIEQFVARISGPGWSNSLGQKLLQLAGPGVPDVYQGTDLFEYSLVDPDNRRPVDWAARRDLLARLDEGWLPDVDADGAAKLLVTTSALRLRRFRPEVFAGYRALTADGPAAAHAVAFQRSPSLVAVATRLPVGLATRGGWGDTVLALPDGAADWHDVVTDTAVDGAAPQLAELLARYPVALLVRPA
jgi:(1->4)-alpha-D-glucan 1-alpha-D-glucosylmutase